MCEGLSTQNNRKTCKADQIVNPHLLFALRCQIVPPARGPCPVAITSCAWLTVNGVNITEISSTTAGAVLAIVPAVARRNEGSNNRQSVPTTVRYLQGDWPVPTIYATGVVPPGLPAAPFSFQVNAEYSANTTQNSIELE